MDLVALVRLRTLLVSVSRCLPNCVANLKVKRYERHVLLHGGKVVSLEIPSLRIAKMLEYREKIRVAVERSVRQGRSVNVARIHVGQSENASVKKAYKMVNTTTL